MTWTRKGLSLPFGFKELPNGKLCFKQDAGGSTADFQMHPEDDAWDPTFLDKPVWQDGESKAGTTEQLQKLLSNGSEKINNNNKNQ